MPVKSKHSAQPAEQWLDFDRQHLWHPYTSATEPLTCYPVVAARGCELILADGRHLVDGMSSWWCAIHGYNHPALNAALFEQTEKMSHVMFGGITHPPAVQLAEQLISMTPVELDHVFLADSGSVSVEVAIKMALQYQHAIGQPQRTRLATIRGGYHGDTAGAMAVCDPEQGMHSLFTGLLPQHLFLPRPDCRFNDEWQEQLFSDSEQLLRKEHGNIAAFILEPIVQGAGGMWFYHPEYLRRIRALCDELDILLIFDEIATGFGRTGKMFALQWADVAPDILCLGKALTGGYLSLAATIATRKVAEGLSSDGGVLMHGPTFMGNPLACAVANASLQLLGDDWQSNVMRIEDQLKQGLMPLQDHKKVADVRVLGAMGVVEMQQAVDVEALQRLFVSQGVWIRPFGKLIYLMPPYIMSAEQLDRLCGAIALAIQQCEPGD